MVNGELVYSHNLGDGILTLPLPGLNLTTNSTWFDIHLQRTGPSVILSVGSGGVVRGHVSGSRGRAQLLDTSQVVYVGAKVDSVNGDIVVKKNFEGAFLSFSHTGGFLRISVQRKF